MNIALSLTHSPFEVAPAVDDTKSDFGDNENDVDEMILLLMRILIILILMLILIILINGNIITILASTSRAQAKHLLHQAQQAVREAHV